MSDHSRAGMTGWDAITCRRPDPHEHNTRQIDIDLTEHGFADHPQVPERLVKKFKMLVWDCDEVDDEAVWCPANDTVSRTLIHQGIWEPCETIVMLDCFERMGGHGSLLDLGAQLGWYSHLARQFGIESWLYEASPENREVLLAQDFAVVPHRIGAEELVLKPGEDAPYVVKIDVEGAEPAAIDMIWDMIAARTVEVILIEMTPRWFDAVELAHELVNVGYIMAPFPDKKDPPHKLTGLNDLEWFYTPRPARDYVSTQEQCNVVFRLNGGFL